MQINVSEISLEASGPRWLSVVFRKKKIGTILHDYERTELGLPKIDLPMNWYEVGGNRENKFETKEAVSEFMVLNYLGKEA